MVKLTAAQTKKLKLHAINQSAGHMKKMIALMKAGESFSEAHAAASKKSVKQKQSQKQSQKVVINLAAPRRRPPVRASQQRSRAPAVRPTRVDAAPAHHIPHVHSATIDK